VLAIVKETNILKTKILVDNATLAASGRAIYRNKRMVLESQALEHISRYSKDYPTSIATDVTSLSELITSVVLFDELTWNRGSFVEEEKGQFTAMMPKEKLWVYSWFPVFNQARQSGVLTEFQEYYSDESSRERESQTYSMQWVRDNYLAYKSKLPSDFKIPAYNKRGQAQINFEK
jgi:hypothetical protein